MIDSILECEDVIYSRLCISSGDETLDYTAGGSVPECILRVLDLDGGEYDYED